MKNYIKLITLVLLINLWPFGCEAQVPCDPIESEEWYNKEKAWNVERADFISTVENLTAENQNKANEILILSGEVDKLRTDINGLNIIVQNKDSEIAVLTEERDGLLAQVEELENRPPETVVDTVEVEADFITVAGKEYKVADIEMIVPFKAIDTILVTHCADSVHKTKWYHHGGVELPYPKDITFATKELAMTRVRFNTPLTDSIKVQPSYQLKRIRDYEKAQTFYEFIK